MTTRGRTCSRPMMPGPTSQDLRVLQRLQQENPGRRMLHSTCLPPRCEMLHHVLVISLQRLHGWGREVVGFLRNDQISGGLTVGYTITMPHTQELCRSPLALWSFDSDEDDHDAHADDIEEQRLRCLLQPLPESQPSQLGAPGAATPQLRQQWQQRHRQHHPSLQPIPCGDAEFQERGQAAEGAGEQMQLSQGAGAEGMPPLQQRRKTRGPPPKPANKGAAEAGIAATAADAATAGAAAAPAAGSGPGSRAGLGWSQPSKLVLPRPMIFYCASFTRKPGLPASSEWPQA